MNAQLSIVRARHNHLAIGRPAQRVDAADMTGQDFFKAESSSCLLVKVTLELALFAQGDLTPPDLMRQ